MIKLVKKEDLRFISDIPPVKEYVSKLLDYLLSEYSTYCADCSISQIGAICYFEDIKDFKNYSEIGLTNPIDIKDFEWVRVLGDYRVFCITADDVYAVNIICSDKLYSNWINSNQEE